MNKNNLTIGIICLFIISALSPIAFGYKSTANDESIVVSDSFDRYLYPEYYDCYSVDEIPNYVEQSSMYEYQEYEGSISKDIVNLKEPAQLLGDPMDSPWSMYCHDVRHTSRSPYITADNLGTEKWRFDTVEVAYGSPIIDSQGVIYIGASDLFAIYPNGTLKWMYDYPHHIRSAPAIDENGVIYIGTIQAMPNYLYAIYTTNGTLKWKYNTGGDDIFSSPVIGDDGTIYFGTGGDYPWYGHINALYPNGTLRWRHETDDIVHSSPTISDDGIIYIGSHDGYLYALYSNNGTLKWKYLTGDWVARGPCIADDGTVYFGSWDGYLYAVYPNGTLKWKTGGDIAGTTPVIAQDGTIYVGNRYLTAIYPSDGSVKWTFDPGSKRTIRGGNPCISADGIIYFGTHMGETDGGELIAVNPDGNERWRIMLATDWIWSAPAIGEDGTVYVGSCNDGYHPGSWGYLHAIGELDPNVPTAPDIDGPPNGEVGSEDEYNFTATSPIGNDLYYWIEWGDNSGTGWLGPYASGEKITASHKWIEQGIWTIRARTKDTDNLWGTWGEFEVEVTKSRNKATYNSLFLQFLDGFPLLNRLLTPLIK